MKGAAMDEKGFIDRLFLLYFQTVREIKLIRI